MIHKDIKEKKVTKLGNVTFDVNMPKEETEHLIKIGRSTIGQTLKEIKQKSNIHPQKLKPVSQPLTINQKNVNELWKP